MRLEMERRETEREREREGGLKRDMDRKAYLGSGISSFSSLAALEGYPTGVVLRETQTRTPLGRSRRPRRIFDWPASRANEGGAVQT